MSSPRIDVDLHKIRLNTRTIVERLKGRGIDVTAVTKAVCGHPAIARAMLDGGASGLADARLSNVKRLRHAEIQSPIILIRTPLLSEVDDVVQICEASYNTELVVIAALAAAAIRQNTVHGIVLMVEMGDQREGIMPGDLCDVAQQVADMPGVALNGLASNFACLNGTAPSAADMRTLSALTNDVESRCGHLLQTVSGGNSANLPWALGQRSSGRTNDPRIGEAILLGADPITGDPIDGLFQDAFALVAEVIETGHKPVLPGVDIDLHPFRGLRLIPGIPDRMRLILAVGNQDTDTSGLSTSAENVLIGATSDHFVVATTDPTLGVGSQMQFRMNYSALMRAMAARDMQPNLCDVPTASNVADDHGPIRLLALV